MTYIAEHSAEGPDPEGKKHTYTEPILYTMWNLILRPWVPVLFAIGCYSPVVCRDYVKEYSF